MAERRKWRKPNIWRCSFLQSKSDLFEWLSTRVFFLRFLISGPRRAEFTATVIISGWGGRGSRKEGLRSARGGWWCAGRPRRGCSWWRACRRWSGTTGRRRWRATRRSSASGSPCARRSRASAARPAAAASHPRPGRGSCSPSAKSLHRPPIDKKKPSLSGISDPRRNLGTPLTWSYPNLT